MQDAFLSEDIILYSLQTLIYRCIPPPQPAHPLQFCDECVLAARISLAALGNAWDEIKLKGDHHWRMFLSWTLMFVPFVPFIVVFGNTIAQNNRQDLALLERVVKAMQSASRVAGAIEKLRVVCERFCLIAQAYLSQQEGGAGADADGRPPLDLAAGAQTQEMEIENMLPNQAMESNVAGGQTALGGGIFDSLPDIPWDGMLNEWDLGLGAEDAREMGNFFGLGQYMSTGASGQGGPGGLGLGFQ